MRAIILSGGKGTRLKPYTITIPKSLVPVGERPILGIIIDQLIKNGFKHITLAVNHMSEIIRAYFGDGSGLGIKLDYSVEDIPLSTIGPLTLINDLPEHFLVMNGDVLTDMSYRDLMAVHLKMRNDMTVATYSREQQIDFGVISLDDNNKIIGFSEKPTYSLKVSMGVYAMSRHLIRQLKAKKPYGFDDLMIDCIKNNNKIASYLYDGYWLDI